MNPSNDNDPRPCRAEGRESSADNRTATSVPTRTRDERDAQDPGDITADALTGLLAEWADIVICLEDPRDEGDG